MNASMLSEGQKSKSRSSGRRSSQRKPSSLSHASRNSTAAAAAAAASAAGAFNAVTARVISDADRNFSVVSSSYIPEAEVPHTIKKGSSGINDVTLAKDYCDDKAAIADGQGQSRG